MSKKLPLVEFTKSLRKDTSLKGVCIIAVQHLLETTHDMFAALYELQLEPQNIYLLGKCYSSNHAVMSRMASDGIFVSQLSCQFDSHLAFDQQFDKCVDQFIDQVFSFEFVHKCKKIIILDDGGHLIRRIHKKHTKCLPNIVCIEQTSSGYSELVQSHLNFPVINVARAPAKLLFEPPMIAEIVLRQIKEKLNCSEKNLSKALVIGNGSIGKALHRKLAKRISTTTYDSADLKRQPLDNLIPKADLIFGCTGVISIPQTKHHLIKKGCTLVSVSSSDREFDSVHLRKSLPSYNNCHHDIHNGHLFLLNSGFPINFDGKKNCVAPNKIQLVRSLLVLAILQAMEIKEKTSGFVELNPACQTAIASQWQIMQK